MNTAHEFSRDIHEAPHRYDVVVSLGTDHHRFDRLVDWIDDYISHRATVTCLVQHGSSRPSTMATSVVRMPSEHLLQLYRNASVVIVQGGPGSILDARGVGKIPLAVPRTKKLGEVVDDHQIAFTDHMVALGEAVRPRTQGDLARMLDAALAHPEDFCTEPRQIHPERASRLLSDSIARAEMTRWHPRDMVRRSLQVARDVLKSSIDKSSG